MLPSLLRWMPAWCNRRPALKVPGRNRRVRPFGEDVGAEVHFPLRDENRGGEHLLRGEHALFHGKRAADRGGSTLPRPGKRAEEVVSLTLWTHRVQNCRYRRRTVCRGKWEERGVVIENECMCNGFFMTGNREEVSS